MPYQVDMETLLRRTVELGGSDLHVVAGAPPSVRIDGAITPLDLPAMKPEDIKEILYPALSDKNIAQLEEEWELDFSKAIPGCARFRGNIIYQRGSLAAVFRAVPFKLPELEKLGLPEDVFRLCGLARGLILVTGPTGSGKSTTLAAMLDYINRSCSQNIVTIEDPIEFLHAHKKSSIRQREVGMDTHSFAAALRQVLRHDPDVIMIGEMRDIESMSTAITAAETGHLVLSTLHTQTAPLTISRVIDSFPEGARQQVRQQLANSLKAVISQQLLPKRDGSGRVAAIEYMIDSPAVRALVREGKEHQLYSAIQTGQSQGMQTMDQALARLLRNGLITKDSALEYCVDRNEFLRISGSLY